MGQIANTARVWAIESAACLAAGALLGMFGPFGSFLNDVLIVRVAYWMIVILVCGIAYGSAIRILAPLARRMRVPLWAWAPAMVLTVSLPLTVITRLVAMAFWPAIGRSVGVVDWYGQTALVSLVYVCVYAVLYRGIAASKGPSAVNAKGTPEILRHLPRRLGGELLCLSMEDHYVRLHAEHGSVLVLMSLSQAMEQLGDLDGLQVHRSWWVARRAVESVIEDGRNVRVVLRGGIEAPVSRANVVRLRSAGWLTS